MNLDFRWIVISCVELIAVVAFLAFATDSWSNSESSWALIALLLIFMLVNGAVNRLAGRLRRRGLRH